MKLTIAKQDLETALNLTSHALGRENWTTHYFIRKHTDDKVEVLSTDHRYCSSAIATCHMDDNTDTFSIEATRVKTWLKNVSDGVALVLNSDGKVVNAKSARGSVRWACVETDNFPYWDQTLGEATSQCVIGAEELHSILSHVRNFVGKPDAKSLSFRYVTFSKGAVLASNGLAMSLVMCDKLDNAKFYLTANDISPLLGFLSKLEGDIEILATDRIVFFKGSNESVFGLTLPSKRSTAGLGNLSPSQYEKTLNSTVGYWEATVKDLQQTIGLLESSMASDDQTIKLSFADDEDGDKSLVLSTLSIAGDVDKLDVSLDTYDDSQNIMSNGQYLNKEILSKVLNIIDTPKMKISVLAQLNNSPCLEHEVAGFQTYSLIVPLQNKTF